MEAVKILILKPYLRHIGSDSGEWELGIWEFVKSSPHNSMRPVPEAMFGQY